MQKESLLQGEVSNPRGDSHAKIKLARTPAYTESTICLNLEQPCGARLGVIRQLDQRSQHFVLSNMTEEDDGYISSGLIMQMQMATDKPRCSALLYVPRTMLIPSLSQTARGTVAVDKNAIICFQNSQFASSRRWRFLWKRFALVLRDVHGGGANQRFSPFQEVLCSRPALHPSLLHRKHEASERISGGERGIRRAIEETDIILTIQKGELDASPQNGELFRGSSCQARSEVVSKIFSDTIMF